MSLLRLNNNNKSGTWRNSVYTTSPSSLPSSSLLPSTYQSTKDPLLIIPTRRTSLNGKESLTLHALILASTPSKSPPTIHYRAMGDSTFGHSLNMIRMVEGKEVFEGELSWKDRKGSGIDGDFEYYVSSEVDGKKLVFPVLGEKQPFSVVVVAWVRA